MRSPSLEVFKTQLDSPGQPVLADPISAVVRTQDEASSILYVRFCDVSNSDTSE